MFITGVIPVHNHAQWVIGAIKSLEEQTMPPGAIVVVNDGSSDASGEVVKKYITDNNKRSLHYIESKTPRGPAAARNAGIRCLWDDTDIFALLDSDDYYHPRKIELSLREFEKDQNIGVVYSDYDTFNESTGLRLRQYKPAYSRELLQRECIICCNSLVRKEALSKVGIFEESLRVVEDFDLWLRVTEHFMAVHIPSSEITIRVGNHSSSSTQSQERWRECYQKVMYRLHERLNRNPNRQ